MGYLDNYLDLIRSRGNIQLAASVQKTANEISNQHLINFSFCDNDIGLLFGNVQSGKTGQVFGVICAAADLGFPAYLFLTTDNVVLQQQTYTRVKSDLADFCVCDEYDTEIFASNSLMKPTIIVLKKNASVLRQWSNIISSTGFMRGNPLFIIDDEADAASLNNLVNKNRQSSINKYLDEIKSRSSCSIYLQVTGTPQSLFLQSLSSGWHPNFAYYFKPGSGYLGGDFFFPSDKKADCVTFIDNEPHPLYDALLHHIVVSAQTFESGDTTCNMMIHPGVRKSSHSSAAREIGNAMDQIKSRITTGSFLSDFSSAYDKIVLRGAALSPVNQLYASVVSLINNMQIHVMNGDNDVTADKYETGSNIIIGGNTLGRGVTFPKLQTIYYTRTAKKPQADTMWQHSRMFGYDRNASQMQVFITETLYKLFADINATNNSIIAQVAYNGTADFEHIKIYLPEGLSPTRKSVLDTDKLLLISGGTNYYPFDPDNDTIEQLDTLLAPFSDDTPQYQISLRLMLEVLSHIKSADDFVVSNYVSAIKAIIKDRPTAQGILIVRRDRDVAKGTGALLSPNDWKLSSSFPTSVVMTLYKMTGSKGWGGKKLWVPNIRFPDGMVYYDVIDEK